MTVHTNPIDHCKTLRETFAKVLPDTDATIRSLDLAIQSGDATFAQATADHISRSVPPETKGLAAVKAGLLSAAQSLTPQWVGVVDLAAGTPPPGLTSDVLAFLTDAPPGKPRLVARQKFALLEPSTVGPLAARIIVPGGMGGFHEALVATAARFIRESAPAFAAASANDKAAALAVASIKAK